jgi:hypothetical protein
MAIVMTSSFIYGAGFISDVVGVHELKGAQSISTMASIILIFVGA